MDPTFNPHNNSDPVSYTCTCPAGDKSGQILLFYRYWDNSPRLAPSLSSQAQDPQALAEFHESLCEELGLGGKFRIAREGFNVTLGGSASSIAAYIKACCEHWSFSGLSLSTAEERNAYFKPTPGCACAFGNKASVRVTAEITPLGITNYSPSSWSNVILLSPEDFHNLCEEGSVPLIDVRNHYESRIGYFVTSKNEIAIRPAVRRFSQWPGYVTRHILGTDISKKPIATYCTGGIRCEKGARWMQEALAADGNRSDTPVYTLHGGIVAYQAWIQQEINAGRKTQDDSFFKGKNYVFDARGSIGSQDGARGKVSSCHGCGQEEDRLGKCARAGCHLVLVVCEQCEERGEVRCCEDCGRIEALQQKGGESKGRRMCNCESEREKSLWGGGGARITQTRKQQKTKAA